MQSSRATGTRGAQKPRILLEPEYAYTDGQDAGELAASYGLQPDRWQQDVLDCWMGRDNLDRFTSTTCGISVPRQNGKNAIIEMRELYGITVNGERILHTAHEVRTARKAFLRLASFFEHADKYPELAEMVSFIRRTNGQEAIVLTNGGQVEFSARSRGAARGFTADVMVMDEAQELTDEQLEALMYAVSASPNDNRQLIYAGTPPPPNSPGTVFYRVRKSVVDGKSDRRTSWHEWSVDEIGDVLDRSRWYATNPAMGIRINEEFTATEVATSSQDGFARERLGWWSDKVRSDSVFEKTEWESCTVEDHDDGIVAFGIKFHPDGSKLAISVAVKCSPPHIELIDIRSTDRGYARIADWLIERKGNTAAIAIDGRSGSEALAQRLIDGGYPRKAIMLPRSGDVIMAATMLLDAVRGKQVSHIAEPLLDESAIGAVKRPIGANGGWGFGTGAADSLAIESASLALWAITKTKRDPTRKMRVL